MTERTPATTPVTARSEEIADRVEEFVRKKVIPFEKDSRVGAHGPEESLVHELKAMAREAGVLTPHILPTATTSRSGKRRGC